MDIPELCEAAIKFTKEHSSVIFSAAAGVGTITTAVLTARASFQAADLIKAHENANNPLINHPDWKLRWKERIKIVWPLYIPAGISATSTIVCLVTANRIELKKTLAAQAAFHVTERAYSEYRDRVVEEFGPRKDQSIRDKVVAEQIKENPPPAGNVLVTGPGNVLCCETFTGRYFVSDMETLRRAQNTINDKVLKHDEATLDDFYYEVGLRPTAYSGRLGWISSRLMELKFSAALTEDNRPCITFDYNYTHTFK